MSTKRSSKTCTKTIFSISKTYSNITELDSLLDDFEFIKTNKKIEYCNVPFSFDIEVTSFKEGDEKRATMYCFVFGINGKTIFARTWEDFLTIMKRISERYGLNKQKRIIVYVHNLAYEFQFIKDLLDWEKVFAVDDRKPIYALSTLGIEFRCSYILSGYSLETLAKNLLTYKLEKKIGDLDYSLKRHSETILTDKEIGYVIHDGLIVMAYIQELIEQYGNITALPLTKTGFVRKYCRDNCLYDGNHRKNKLKYLKYQKQIHKMNIVSASFYRQLKRAFQGGFTHANAYNVRITHENVISFDEISAYPSVMVSELFPMSEPKRVKIKSKEEFEDCLKNYCCLFDIKFFNIRSSTQIDNIISSSKCFDSRGMITDNGRVVEAEYITTTITEVDYEMISKFYKWDKIQVKNMRIFYKGYLPTDFVKSILDLYQKKTTLKGVDGMELEYMNSKENLNSCYGMTVTDILQDSITYDGEKWTTKKADEKEIEKYNNSKNRFLYYPWGIWVTAYARRNLYLAMLELGTDLIYVDTDSVKFLHAERHLNYFKRYNAKVYRKMIHAMDYHKLDYKLIEPKTKDGKTKILGQFELDGVYKRFKTLGAKRYMAEYAENIEYKTKDGKILHLPYSLTVSGLNKKITVPYLYQIAKERGINIFDLFDDKLYIPKGYTGKNTHTYIDYPQRGTFTDCNGLKGTYSEMSSIHMEEAEYSLSMTSDYINYIIGLREVTR